MGSIGVVLVYAKLSNAKSNSNQNVLRNEKAIPADSRCCLVLNYPEADNSVADCSADIADYKNWKVAAWVAAARIGDFAADAADYKNQKAVVMEEASDQTSD